MADWDEVRDLAPALPGTAATLTCGTLAWTVNGKGFVLERPSRVGTRVDPALPGRGDGPGVAGRCDALASIEGRSAQLAGQPFPGARANRRYQVHGDGMRFVQPRSGAHLVAGARASRTADGVVPSHPGRTLSAAYASTSSSRCRARACV